MGSRSQGQGEQISNITKSLENLTAMLEKLLGEPEPPKVAAKAVAISKEEDQGRKTEASDPLSLIKRSHTAPALVPAVFRA